ncbi:hypothetical protein [Candidatus Sororendozoicomonas aggregata]|uniref:hypothetical protein n=1 Tax=Candidatus Sororendozoicomonas aggregata TaxID=3073239 RepID=UPI002ED3EB11
MFDHSDVMAIQKKMLEEERKRKTYSFRCDKELETKIEAYTRVYGIPASEMFRIAVEEWITDQVRINKLHLDKNGTRQ